MMAEVPTVKFYNGAEIPIIGLGTWRAKPDEVRQAIKDAIDVGYRHIDAALLYDNEKEIGDGIREKIQEGVIKREDIFITGKLWNNSHRPGAVEPALNITLNDLGIDYIDLYLIHWPIAYKEGSDLFPVDANGKPEYADYDYVETWKAMEKIYEKGLAKNIGVSNFNEEQIERILKEGKIKPVTNQVECQPYLTQIKLSEYCKSKGITLSAYRPLGGLNNLLTNDANIVNIAKKYNKSAAQVLLRYQIQRGHIVLVKSVSKTRLRENLDIFNFELSKQDMDLINSFNCNRRHCGMLGDVESPYYPFEK